MIEKRDVIADERRRTMDCQPNTQKRRLKRTNPHVLENRHKDKLLPAKFYSKLRERVKKSIFRVFVRVLASPKWFLLGLD